MNRIWAPWRGEYVESIDSPKSGECIFCREFTPQESTDSDLSSKSKKNPDKLVLFTDDKAVVMMNKFPYNNGHVLIAPVTHTSEFETLEVEISNYLTKLINLTITSLKDCYSPDGFNIGMNLGRIAGAGIPDHLHYHVVPRWNGDSNFMPAIGETKVMPEHILKSVEKLKPYFK